eukprot:scaffold645_cov247-Pinguiococcus_pyrenoidosus.AAC.23
MHPFKAALLTANVIASGEYAPSSAVGRGWPLTEDSHGDGFVREAWSPGSAFPGSRQGLGGNGRLVGESLRTLTADALGRGR